MNHTKRNRGFSIMETVIALVVIVLVTAAALSITMAAISARVKMSNYSEAQDFAHNVLECFKAAKDDNVDDRISNFENNVGVAGYKRENLTGTNPDYRYKAENKFEAKITADFDDDYFEIVVTEYGKDDKIIIQFEYGQKG